MKKFPIITVLIMSFAISQAAPGSGMSMWANNDLMQNPDVVRKPAKKVEPKKEVKKEEPKPEPKKEEPKPEPKKEVVKEEPKPEPKKEEPKKSAEYARSVGELNISQDTFENDKKDIMKLIAELAVVMKEKNFKNWLNYIDQESIQYWSQSSNLRKAQSRMPIKGIQLRSLEDYFKYVFVPARANRQISEIRYISETYVKAVETQNSKDLVYYYVKQNDGKWIVNIPPL